MRLESEGAIGGAVFVEMVEEKRRNAYAQHEHKHEVHQRQAVEAKGGAHQAQASRYGESCEFPS